MQIDPQEQDELSNLFGIHKPDESIILDMFSRKLDKLFISTYSHDEHLPEEWADAICEVVVIWNVWKLFSYSWSAYHIWIRKYGSKSQAG